jgi:hypothetical protein
VTQIATVTSHPSIRLSFGNSGVSSEIRSIWPDAIINDPLTVLIQRLNEDKECTYAAPEGSRPDDFLISTPRVRLRCSPDNRDDECLRIWRVELNTVSRWRADAKRGSKASIQWSHSTLGGNCGRDELLRHVQERRAGTADPATFWDYWHEYLAKEFEKIEEVKNHPGWSYAERRWGLTNGAQQRGTVDFRVDDDQEQLLATCDSRVLLEVDGEDQSRPKVVPFELHSPAAPRWVTAATLGRVLQLDEIPKSGRLKPDWISLQTEFRRRRDALQQLIRGETALPGLNRILPDGDPHDHNIARPFAPILDIAYNRQQASAIEKALCTGTVTCVLGPPGTGKTSVIAEIASQVAGSGGRVLISSQSNLAVDNALERVVDSDDVFRVRVGRPESVKLNPELLIDRASERYRQQLLRKTKAAAEAEEQAIRAFPTLPDRKNLADLLLLAREYADKRARIESLSRSAAIAERIEQEVLRQQQDAQKQLEVELETAFLQLNELRDFLEIGKQMVRQKWQPEEVSARTADIRLALRHREEVQKLEALLGASVELSSKRSALTDELTRIRERIRESQQLEAQLVRTKESNRAIEDKRRTSGFWKRLGSYLTDMIEPTEWMEIKIRQLDRRQAERRKPDVKLELQTLEAGIQETSAAIRELLATLDSDYGSATADSILKRFKADIMIGNFIEKAEAFKYMPAYRYWKELRHAADRVDAVTQEVEHATKTHAERKKAADYAAAQYPKELATSCYAVLIQLAAKLDISAPLSLPRASSDAVQDFCNRIQSASEAAYTRKERWERLSQALHLYQARLQVQNINLQSAVVHEANVVAATCSGIAGAKDFNSTFDYVIIDEAGRATPLDLLMPMVKGTTVVLVGDHKQLPPMLDRDISDELAASDCADVPLFERLFRNSSPTRTEALSSQYRMVQEICDVVSDISYWPEQRLETSGLALSRRHPFPSWKPIHWVKCTGRLNRAASNGRHSLRNQAEVLAAVAVAEKMGHHLEQIKPDRPYEIGIISMYRDQVVALEDALPRAITHNPFLRVQLGTVDAFQGREKDAIILTFVATDPDRKYFFFDRRRLNVALSRAKELLIIVGGLDVLGRKQKVFGHENPVARLRELIAQSAIAGRASTEVFHAN